MEPRTPLPVDTDGTLAKIWGSTPNTFQTPRLNHFAADVSTWHARELPGADMMRRVAKVAEEAGELIGAAIKWAQQSNGYKPERDFAAEARDELADVIIAAMGAAEALGIRDVDQAVADRWLSVRERRFASKLLVPALDFGFLS